MESQELLNNIIRFATEWLKLAMCCFFVLGVTARWLIWTTFKREDWFSKEFNKRVDLFIESNVKENGKLSFYFTTKKILEKTFYELFKKRTIMKRRNPDVVMVLVDRIFLIQHGCARLVKDTLKQIKYIKFGNSKPPMLRVAKNVFQINPCFNKIFGVIPASVVNDVLGILPGLFIIGGIFGTFLGIMQALPALTNMDLTDIERSKDLMNEFLLNVTFSMSTSIVGIMLSVSMSILNTLLSPEKVFINIVERYENTLMALWDRSSNNSIIEDGQFDENRDALEALAENAVNEQLNILPTTEGKIEELDENNEVLKDNVQEQALAQEQAPAQEQALAQQQAPAQEQALAQQQAPAQEQAPVQQQATVQPETKPNTTNPLDWLKKAS